jgi:DNA-damage-inducible protein D
MAEGNLPVPARKSFEELKARNQYGAEYWTARDLQPLLGYDQWQRFENAIKKAMVSCERSGNDPSHHFAGAGKMITLGSGNRRNGNDPGHHFARAQSDRTRRGRRARSAGLPPFPFCLLP